jgi:hypothetical protein
MRRASFTFSSVANLILNGSRMLVSLRCKAR